MRIGILGSGGAGITAAWLLDGRHQVTVLERNAVLGGHAHTTRVEIDGAVHYADDGFSWFSDVLYPNYMRLLELTGVPTRIVKMSASFTQVRTGSRTLVLPPRGVGGLLRTVLHLPTLRDLLQLNRAIGLAEPLVHGHDRLVSWGEFIRKHQFPEPFCRDLLTPMVAGVWGGPYERIEDFSAYTLMKYLVFHRPSSLARYKWHVVRDGAASYIAQVAAQLPQTTLLTNAAAVQLRRQGLEWHVTDATGREHVFDRIVCAMGSRDAQNLLRDAAGLEQTKAVLGRFEYYTSKLATHSDPSFMPPRRQDWQIANIRADGDRANLTVWTDAHRGGHVFTSYVENREPEHCHNLSTFQLPLITPGHYRAQDELAARQGSDGLYFVGDWTRDIGCHEDAVVSAIQAVRALDPQAPRLAALAAPRLHPAMRPLPPNPALLSHTQPAGGQGD